MGAQVGLVLKKSVHDIRLSGFLQRHPSWVLLRYRMSPVGDMSAAVTSMLLGRVVTYSRVLVLESPEPWGTLNTMDARRWWLLVKIKINISI